MHFQIREVFSDFLSLVFPNICINCGTVLVAQEELVCLKCKFDLPKTQNHLDENNPFLKKFAFEPKVTFVYSYLWYQEGNTAQKLISNLKYKNRPQIGTVLGRWYGNVLKPGGINADYFIPVPLNRKKEAMRGYNQSERFARGLSQRLGIPVNTEVIKRVVNTETQTKKSRLDRWLNMDTVFKVINPSQVVGRRIIIVDDVLTTGATIGNMVDLLVVAGVESIGIITIGVGK